MIIICVSIKRREMMRNNFKATMKHETLLEQQQTNIIFDIFNYSIHNTHYIYIYIYSNNKINACVVRELYLEIFLPPSLCPIYLILYNEVRTIKEKRKPLSFLNFSSLTRQRNYKYPTQHYKIQMMFEIPEVDM